MKNVYICERSFKQTKPNRMNITQINRKIKYHREKKVAINRKWNRFVVDVNVVWFVFGCGNSISSHIHFLSQEKIQLSMFSIERGQYYI